MKKFQYVFFACAVFAGAFLFGKPVFAGTSFQFSPSKMTVKEGQVFTVTTKVIPPGVKNYTVKMVLEFPSDMVAVKSWSYTDDWMPVRKSGYDVLSNDEGVLIRTAGYPEGFDSATTFGTITLMAKKSGVAALKINGESFILDQNGNNVATLPAPFSFTIEAAPLVEVPEIKKELPLVTPKQKVEPVVPVIPILAPESISPVKELVPVEQNTGVLPTNDLVPEEEVAPVVVEPVKPVEVSPVPAVQKVKKQVTPSRSFDISSFVSSDDSLLLLLITALIFVLIAISREVANMPNNKLRINRP